MEIKITVPLPSSIKDRLFNDHDPVPIENTPDDPEFDEVNEQLRQMNKELREQEGKDVKTIKDMFER